MVEPKGPVCYSPDGRQRVGTSLVGEHAAWSPDGQRIVVTRPGLLDAPTDGSHPIVVYSAAPDGSDMTPLVLGGEKDSSLRWELVAAQAVDEDVATSRAACTAGFVVPAPDANPGLVRDCETLSAARAALFGERLTNWGSGFPACSMGGRDRHRIAAARHRVGPDP